MSDAIHLAIEALSTHPAEGAQVLEDEEPVAAAALLEALAPGAAAAVVAAMLPTPAAHCVAAADPGWAGRVLARLGTAEAAALLRCLPARERRRLLQRLPARRALPLRIVLDYPPDTVGAWMDPRVATVRSDGTVAEARTAARGGPSCELFAVAGGRRLAGVVRVPRLFQAAPGEPLAPLVETAVPALPAWSQLRHAPQAPGWQAYNALPVVDRAGNLVGGLPATVLFRAMAEPTPREPAGPGLGWSVVRAYGEALGGLLGLLFGEDRRER